MRTIPLLVMGLAATPALAQTPPPAAPAPASINSMPC